MQSSDARYYAKMEVKEGLLSKMMIPNHWGPLGERSLADVFRWSQASPSAGGGSESRLRSVGGAWRFNTLEIGSDVGGVMYSFVMIPC